MEGLTEWARVLSDATGIKAWALDIFLIVLAAMLLDLLQRRLMKRLGKVVERTENLWDDALFHAAGKPVALAIWVIGITVAAQLIPDHAEQGLISDAVLASIRQLGVLAALTWFLLTLVLNVEDNVVARAERQGREIDRTTVKALGRVVRITITVTAILIALDVLGFNVAGLMAAGGIGGLAVGFAAKDMLANLFGGLTVFIDRPFGIGDWILIRGEGIEGTVEQIGWRQTTIRKFDKRPVYVPNAIFTTASVENPSRMTHRRINETIGIRYDDIAVMQAITDQVREMLVAHPEIDDSQTLMVQFNAFGPHSLDFFIYCMTHTVVWQRFHEVKQDVLLKISAIIDRNGAEIAYPTQRLVLEDFERPDPDSPPAET